MLLRYSLNIQSHLRLKQPNLLYSLSKDDLSELRDGEDTICSGSLFQIGATLFRKKLCVTVTEWEIVTITRLE